MKYLATTVPGFAPFVRSLIEKGLPDYSHVHTADDDIVFESSCQYDSLIQKPYLTNVFQLMASESDQSQKDIIKRTKSLLESADCSVLSLVEGSYRIMIQQGSRLVHIPRSVQIKIRKTIETGTRLTYNPRKAKTEIRFLLRSNGRGYLGVSHILQKPFDAIPIVKGALHPRMAHMLNLFSLPTDVDVFLDPFAGFGNIVYDRARFFRYQTLFASDLNASLVSQLRARFKDKKDAQIVVADARRLDYIADSGVTRVVTDPPWGLYDKDIDDSEDLYRDVFCELARVMKPEGILVILSAGKKEVEKAVIGMNRQANRKIDIEAIVRTLVNGKEAWVWRMMFSCRDISPAYRQAG